MISKSQARTKAASIKATLTDLEAAIDALPASAEKTAVVLSSERLHRKLNHAARRMADFFDDSIETFSGGTDKPDEE